MKTIFAVLSLAILGCSAAPPGESIASDTEAIDPTHGTTVPLKSFIVPPKLSKFTPVPAVRGVINLNALKKLPGVIWALNTKTSVAPVYVTCSPGFQNAENFCYNNYIGNANVCDATYSINTTDCGQAAQQCQTASCNQQYSTCAGNIPECFDTSCLAAEQEDLNICGNNSAICDSQIQSNGECGLLFEGCVNSAESEDGSCRSFAAEEYDACQAPIGSCF